MGRLPIRYNLTWFRYAFLVTGVSLLVLAPLLIIYSERSLKIGWIETALKIHNGQLNAIAKHLILYHSETGRYPTNDKGLLAIPSLVNTCKTREGDWDTGTHEIYRDFCRIDESGILTVWGEPFIYENRRGLDPLMFSDSGATVDTNHKYSIEVDKGVYIWSVAARYDYEHMMKWQPRFRTYKILVITLGFIFLFLYFILTIVKASNEETVGLKIWRAVSTLLLEGFFSLVLAAILFPVFVRSCYAMSWNRRRTPELTDAYIQQLRICHEKGIISDVAYRKIAEAVRRP